MIRSQLVVACVLSGLSTTAPAFGDGLEDWLGAPHTSNLVAAQRGGRIAFVMNKRGARNVYVADAPGDRPRQVTRYDQDDGRLISRLVLTPDGKTAVFTYGNEPGEIGNVNPTADIAGRTQSVVALDLGSGASQVLSEGVEGRCGNPSGCTELAMSPDGEHVAIRLVRELQRRGVRVEQMLLPDQTHFMTPWSAWVKMYRTTATFLERELRPRG